MKQTRGFLLLVLGIVCMVVAIMTLSVVFMQFEMLAGQSSEVYAYTFAKLFFPLLLMVFGRYLYRKGKTLIKRVG